jgi:alkaline phosphatase
VPDRNWEADTSLPAPARAAGCRDLARQFVEFAPGDGIDVAFAGGRAMFLPATSADPEYPDQHGVRGDGRDLVAEWRARHPAGRYAWNAKDFAAIDPAATGQALALFEPSHMHFEHDRGGDGAGEPSLEEMTRKAIAILARKPGGFVLMVEGGRIDHAHHAGNAYRALDETIEFAKAVHAADEMTDDADTLILVTADHSHTLTFVGYPQRGNPILGKVVGVSEDGQSGLALDAMGKPYTTLGYANGPGYPGASDTQPAGPKKFEHRLAKSTAYTGRPDLGQVDTTAPDYLQETGIPTGSETHGGDDVGIWAHGTGADAVRGSVEQNTIFHFLLQAAPALRAYVCGLAACEQGVPVAPPDPARLAR